MAHPLKAAREKGARARGQDNALVVDLEFWYSPEFVRGHVLEQNDDQLPQSVVPLLDILAKYRTRATFAVLGTVAERYPELVKLIFNQGHEIASHGYSHKTLYELSENDFEQEIVKSVELLTSITGERPVGFRAPSYSLNNSTKWALQILCEHGFKYDASVFPIKTNLYGVPGAPLHPYRPSVEDIAKESQHRELVEFPMTVFKLGMNIPVAGGFYLRVLPSSFLKFALKRTALTRPVIVYIHPWETYDKTPRVDGLPRLHRFVTYYGINKALWKLEQLLAELRFRPIKEVLAEEGLI